MKVDWDSVMLGLIPVSCRELINGTQIVFVHGLFGDSDNTWMYEDWKSNFDWTRQLEEDLEHVKVWKFGYISDLKEVLKGETPVIEEISERLKSDIENNISTNCEKIIFISHSLGGIIVKQLINELYRDEKKGTNANGIFSRIESVVFLSTPHSGSRYADVAVEIISFINIYISLVLIRPFKLMSINVIKQLTVRNKILEEINEKYANVTGYIKHLELVEGKVTDIGKILIEYVKKNIKCECIKDTSILSVKILNKNLLNKMIDIFELKEVVNNDEQTVSRLELVTDICEDEDHITISKPRNPESKVYKEVVNLC